ncbi:hypothetical protein RBH29_09450 [Herbivorax sp. ANBcel31]|uniref:hypothetical protein n=1 Tax=Herbivorax sp. ANBcel31 TaxID=3069754 RepID=UPI0027B306DC|nr:hypothetical protein [Herbivorax sp. ANBcel31]MDQ2086648.1 hypothetical protein [Herbivorax sp. ANBcel31]
MKIMANVVAGRYVIEKELMLHKELKRDMYKDRIINNIVLCEARNIKDNSYYISKKINIKITFDLVIVYEYIEGKGFKREYDIISEKIKKNYQFEQEMYDAVIETDLDVKILNRLKNVNYLTDIDLHINEFSISIYCTIESFLLQENEIYVEEGNLVTKNSIKINDKFQSRFNLKADNSLIDNVTGSLIQAEMSLFDVVEKATNLHNSNSNLQTKLKTRENQVNVLKNNVYELKKENEKNKLFLDKSAEKTEKLKKEIIEKNRIINGLEEEVDLEKQRYKEALSQKEKVEKLLFQSHKKGIFNRVKSKIRSII